MARVGRFIRKTLLVLAALVSLGLGVLAVVLSHDSACGTAPPLPAGAATMKGVAYRCYGSADVLEVEQLEKPVPKDDEVLVKVQAAALNPLDWHYMHGAPYLMRLSAGIGRPENPRVGVDFAGTVEAVGKSVTRFHPGDEVFGARNGALAEYLVVRESRNIVSKPANVTFEQGASVGVAAITALQSLRDKGQLKAGQKVLINGASGGVGTFAVQFAKVLGAEVTGVCSTRNIELVRSLGADHVIDYTKEDFTQGAERYDLIVDNVGNLPLLASKNVLTPKGRMVLIGGGGPDGKWIEPFTGPLKAFLLKPFVDQEIKFMLAEITPAELEYIGGLMQSGQVKAVIDSVYPVTQVREAMRHLEEGHARGKVIVSMDAAHEPRG